MTEKATTTSRTHSDAGRGDGIMFLAPVLMNTWLQRISSVRSSRWFQAWLEDYREHFQASASQQSIGPRHVFPYERTDLNLL